MSKGIFREKTVEQMTAPEELNERIRVENPAVWVLLLGVVLVLVGICVWGFFGRVDTVIPVGAMNKDGKTVCYVKETDIPCVKTGMTVKLQDGEYTVGQISAQPILVDGAFPEYLRYVGELSEGEWVYEVTLDRPYGNPGNVTSAEIVIESIAPAGFVIN